MSGFRNKRGNIYLIGPRASGKTTLAEDIAGRTGLKAVDADKALQEEQGQSIQEIVSGQGWEYFRDLESKFLQRTAGSGPMVVATGGGVVLGSANRELLKDFRHLTVYLQAEADLICSRLAEDPKPGQRPALSDLDFREEIRATLEKRQKLYMECADIVLAADQPLELLAEEVYRVYVDKKQEGQ